MHKKNMSSFFGLSWRLAAVDFKLRNEGSYLGTLWYFLNPLLLFLTLNFVFAQRLGADIPDYPVYLLIGILLFNFFTRTTLDATQAVRESGFIKSFTFKREALVLSVVLKHLMAHIFESGLFFVVLLLLGLPLYSILIYFLILFFVAIFVFGCSLLLAALTMFFTDLANVWSFFTTLVWFATPIFYSIEGQETLLWVNQANPMYYFITASRDGILTGVVPELQIVIGVVLFPLITLSLGLYVFNALKPKFAEMI